MNTTDFANISLSAIALILSLVATVISIVRGRYEQQRAVRNQIMDVLSRIVTVNLEQSKLYREVGDKDPAYLQNVSGILNQQNTFLIQQAIYLMEQVPKLVTAVEYNTVAAANFNAGDMILAERYYKKAIEVAPNNYYKALGMRSFANFQFMQQRFDEGREQYQKSITLLNGTDNLTRYTNGLTYQMWAWNELANAGAPKRAEQLVENARAQFGGIDNEAVRINALRGLEAAFPAQAAPYTAATRQNKTQ
jgi:tetratricopeptide (TPR) repeat protein